MEWFWLVTWLKKKAQCLVCVDGLVVIWVMYLNLLEDFYVVTFSNVMYTIKLKVVLVIYFCIWWCGTRLMLCKPQPSNLSPGCRGRRDLQVNYLINVYCFSLTLYQGYTNKVANLKHFTPILWLYGFLFF